ncbi:MAG: alkaline phosphatase family protein [Candidatus Lutacidiplasmatales archaeon]
MASNRSEQSLRSARLVAIAVVVLLAAGVVPSGHASSPGVSGAPRTPRTASDPNLPFVQHVVVVVLENEVLSEIWGHGPYERYLAATYGNASNVYAACHPSAPNYLAMFAAVVNQCGSDTWKNYTNRSLNLELDAANLSWAAYAENLPTGACADPGSATTGLFATRHVPALWMANVLQTPSYCSAHVRGSNEFNSSAANGTLPSFSFYTPNLCDDGHDGCGSNTTNRQLTAQADAWLQGWLSPILNHTGTYASAAEQAEVNHTAFFVTWDEGIGSNAGFAVPGITGGDNYLWCGQNGAVGDAACGGRVFTAVVSPYSRNTTFVANDSTYGLCRTVEWLFHLPSLGNPGSMDNQSGFPAMTSLFRFPPEINVSVRESNLPLNAVWWFNVTGLPPTSTNGTALVLDLPNGTYSYTAAAAPLSWSTPNGSFRVNGTPTNLSVAFTYLTYPVTFVEHGLAPGVPWRLAVNGTSEGTTGNGSVVVHLPDGRQTFVATTNDSTWSSPAGSFRVVGAPLQVNVTFGRVTFAATVTASGLAPSTVWWLNVTNGPQASGASSALSVSLPNGSFPYTAQAAGNVWSRAAGTLEVAGGPASGSADFSLEVYNVTFVAVNLSGGSEWNLTFGGTVRTVAGDGATSFLEPNGSYAYTAAGARSYPVLHPDGVVPVSGGPVTVTVRFDPPLTITEFAATPGNVTLGSTLVFGVVVGGGTGPYQLQYNGLPRGCADLNATAIRCAPSELGRFVVVLEVSDSIGAETSANTMVVVASASPPTGSAASEVPPWAIAVVVVAAAAVTVGALVLWRRSRRPG